MATTSVRLAQISCASLNKKSIRYKIALIFCSSVLTCAQAFGGTMVATSISFSPAVESPDITNAILGDAGILWADASSGLVAHSDTGLRAQDGTGLRAQGDTGLRDSDVGTLCAQGGTGLRAQGGTGLRAQGGTGLRAQGGTGLRAQGGTGLRAQGGTGLRAQGGTGLRAQGGTGLRAQGGTGLRAQGGTGLRAQGGTGLRAQGGTGLRTQDGTGFSAQGGTSLRNNARNVNLISGPVDEINLSTGEISMMGRRLSFDRAETIGNGEIMHQQIAVAVSCRDESSYTVFTSDSFFVPGVTEVVIEGIVDEINKNLGTLMIGVTIIKYSDLLAGDFLTLELVPGDFVRVRGLYYPKH